MAATTHHSSRRLVQGLDPLALAGVLQDATPPAIPGWEVGEPLGSGGLGTVWKATRTSDGTVAAIKVPRAEDISLIERLETEATALRALDHPGIVRLLETGPLDNGSLYLAMEYVDGPPLSQAIPPGGFPAARACQLFTAIAAAVAHAHSRGVLHRDLKPGNILLDATGQPHVADFGLAHSVAGRVLRLSLTLAGQVAGTAEYLPPEAYQRDYQPDTTADVYALGVILYELLTGSPPRGAWDPVSLRKADADIRLDDLLRRALDPDPARRFPTVHAMQEELQRILRSPARYSGTPRLTRAVRGLDFLWTLLGLFLLFGSLSLVNRIQKYDIGLPLDLIGQNTIRIGTYQGVFILLVCAVPFGLWQLIRLWRFRRVPLRESLPAPFGIRLGTTSMAAAIILLSQVLFIAVPWLLGGYSWRERCTTWLDETSAPWNQGLIVTQGYRGTVPHDPWAWPEPGKTYSLRERSGWITDPRSIQYDHTHYYPGLIPRLLAGLTLFSAAFTLLTLAAALARWWRYRKWGRSLTLLALLAWAHHTVQAGPPLLQPRGAPDIPNMPLEQYARELTARQAASVLHALYLQNQHATPFTPDEHLPHLAPTLQCGSQPPATGHDRLAALARYAATFTTPHRHFLNCLHLSPLSPGGDGFTFLIGLEDCTDPPGAPATGALTALTAHATFHPPHGIAIHHLTHHTTPLWTADPSPLTPAAAHTWATALLTALHHHTSPPPPGQSPPAPTLEDLIHPLILGPHMGVEWEPVPRLIPAPGAPLAADLRTACEHGARPRLSHPPGPAQPQPGGRHRIHLEIEDRGQPATWVADLIHTSGRWQCVRLLYTDQPGR